MIGIKEARRTIQCLAVLLLWAVFTSPVISQDDEIVGFLEPYIRVGLGFSEAGAIGAVHVREGQSVNKGDILAELDNRVLDASIAIARARSESEVEVRLAEINLEDRVTRHQQLERLRQNGNAREDEVVRAALERETAEYEVRAAVERRRIAQLDYQRILAQRNQRRIVSPINGIVIGVEKQVGETVNAVDSPAILVAQLSILKLVFRIDEVKARGLQHALPLSILVSGNDRPVVGAVEYVSPVMDARSGTVEVWAVIDNQSGSHKSGQRASVQWD